MGKGRDPGRERAPSAAIVAQAPVGIGFWDLDCRYRQANAALAEINGTPVEAAIGRTLPEVLGPLGEEIAEVLRAVLATDTPVLDLAVHGQTAAQPGVDRDWLGSYYPVHDDDGTLIGVAAIVREVTDQRLLEVERDRLLRDALLARAQAETARARAEAAGREAEAARARTAFIAEAGARMATSLDATRTLRELAQLAVSQMADWCAISLVGPDGRFAPAAVSHADPARRHLVWEMIARRPLHVDDPVGPPAVLRSGEPQLIVDAGPEMLDGLARDEVHLAQLRELGLRSSIVVALKTPERAIGTLTLVYSDSGRRYGPEDVEMARALAGRAALHVENARLYADRSHIARTLEAGLLPVRLPEIAGVDLVVRYLAAGDQNAVGGDFYDVVALGDGIWTAVVGDVSGKGAAAAVLTALTRHTLYAGALRGGDGASNLRLLNEALLRRAGEGEFCTVVTAEIRPQASGTVAVRLANGGHPAPLVLRADGSIERTVAGGTLIGAVSDPQFETQDLVLEPGDLLLLYTDGAIELRGADPADGERRLLAALAGLAGRSAAHVVAGLEEAVVEASGGAPRDDLALLAFGPA